ncbi:hypothetical protein ACNHKD_03660 [Methylocystis sp. JAN1]|uniref:hypothetical protein n=1 Tax=Methylocystis sp. JAN1 TaxID=3397211 RepID=UPI003FA2E3E7
MNEKEEGSERASDPGDAMEARARVRAPDEHQAEGRRQSVGENIVQDEPRIMEVPDKHRHDRADALGRDKESPEKK